MTATLQSATTVTGTVVPSALVRAIDAVLPHACDWRDALPILASVELSARDGVLTLAATDRYTLGTYAIAWDGPDFDSAILTVKPDSQTADQVKALQRMARGVGKSLRDLSTLALEITLPRYVGDEAARLTVRHFDEAESFALYTFAPYVKWRAIVPEYADDLPGIPWVGISPANLAKFARVTDESGAYVPLRLTFGPSAVKPVVVTAGPFRGLIMPVRMPTE